MGHRNNDRREHSSERSGIHRFVERQLDALGIAYESEFRNFEPYRVDIYISEAYAYIEVDGPSHSRSKDKKRDDWLQERYNLRGLHLDFATSRDIWNAENIRIAVVNFLEIVTPSAQQRRGEYQNNLQK